MKKKSDPKVCPWCSCARYKTTKTKNVTRCCGEVVAKVNGGWYRRLDDAPEWQIMQSFARWKRKTGDSEYVIEFNDPTYQESIRSAKTLLERCGGDTDLARAVLEISFTHRSHSWRNKPALWAILHKKFWADVLSKAKTQERTKQRHQDLQERRSSSVTGNPNMVAAYAAATRSI